MTTLPTPQVWVTASTSAGKGVASHRVAVPARRQPPNALPVALGDKMLFFKFNLNIQKFWCLFSNS